MREEKVVRAFAAVSVAKPTAEDLLPHAYDDTSPALFPIALLSLRSHLEKLIEDGRVVAIDGAYTIARS
jgi:hypothetical protein